jgi:hypothetical protein
MVNECPPRLSIMSVHHGPRLINNLGNLIVVNVSHVTSQQSHVSYFDPMLEDE